MTRPAADQVPPRNSWKALLIAPVVATTHFLVVYLAAEAACSHAIDGFGTTPLRWLIAAATATTAGLLASAAYYALRLQRHAQSDHAGGDGDGDSDARTTRRFLASTGLTLCGLFAFFVALVAAPVIGSSLC